MVTADPTEIPAPDRIRDAARELLASAGIVGPPVDLLAVLDYLGLAVNRWQTCPASIAGFLHSGSGGPEIVVNYSQPVTRRRFTGAHEIGEYLFGDRSVLLMSLTDDDWLTAHEEAMNQFAAELLMPADWVRQEVERAASFKELCQTFRVSLYAMTRRLRDLELVYP